MKGLTVMAATDKNSLAKSVAAGILTAIGLFSVVVLLGNSWIKIALISLILIGTIVWLKSHGTLKKAVKILLLGAMIFATFFTTAEGYLLWNAGFPPTSIPEQGVTISQANILNVSLAQILQSIKTTPTFSLISLEYPSEISFESMDLETTIPGGRIEVTFYQQSSNLGFRFASSSGGSYHASVFSWDEPPLSQKFMQKQTPEESLKQIDSLGLNWFYNKAIEEYQKQTGVDPHIKALQVSIQWERYESYQGMTLLLIGYEIAENDNSGQGIFFAAFQPNGTMLYLNAANPKT